jgi:uncharacterized protein GlcG (DUF336 family)
MKTLSSVTLTEAAEIGEYILATAKSDGGKHIAIVIVDVFAEPVWSVSMSRAKAPAWRNAYAKAHTAVKFERDTVKFRFMDPGVAGTWVPATAHAGWSQFDLAQALHLDPLFCGWAGGSLILNPADGSIMGAVGVSNREELQDHELASLRPSGWTA